MQWPRVRAALIAVAIGFGLIDGFPLPHRGFESPWQQGFVPALRSVKATLSYPIAWLHPVLQAGQQWSLYQSPGGEQYRLWIEGRDRAGAWHLLFRAGDPTATDDDEVLTSARLRGAYQVANHAAPQYRPFAEWVSRRELARHADLDAIRVQLEEIAIERGVVTSAGQFLWPNIMERAR